MKFLLLCVPAVCAIQYFVFIYCINKKENSLISEKKSLENSLENSIFECEIHSQCEDIKWKFKYNFFFNIFYCAISFFINGFNVVYNSTYIPEVKFSYKKLKEIFVVDDYYMTLYFFIPASVVLLIIVLFIVYYFLKKGHMKESTINKMFNLFTTVVDSGLSSISFASSVFIGFIFGDILKKGFDMNSFIAIMILMVFLSLFYFLIFLGGIIFVEEKARSKAEVLCASLIGFSKDHNPASAADVLPKVLQPDGSSAQDRQK